MAGDDVFVVNALLCFLLYVFKKHPVKFLSSIISDFYTVEMIGEAKERLLFDIDALKLDKWTKPPSRRGDNKRKHDLEDIIAQITLLDEGGLLNSLPKYVVDNLDNVPMIRMERGEFSVLVSKLDKLSDDLNTHIRDVSQSSVRHCNQSDLATVTGQDTNVASRAISENIRSIRNRDWAAESDVDTSDGQFTSAISRSSKRRRAASTHQVDNAARSARSADLGGSVLNPAPVLGPSSYAGAVLTGASVGAASGRAAAGNGGSRSAMPRVVGSSRAVSGFKAARPYVKKAIYALYNVDRKESAESLTKFVKEELSVDVISCFETNLQNPNSYSRSFRLCINAKDNQLFLVPDKWCDGIVIKKWRFDNREQRQHGSGTASAAPCLDRQGTSQGRGDTENTGDGVTGACESLSADAGMMIDPVLDNQPTVGQSSDQGQSRSSS
jgi:hypothetical protein